MNIIVIGTTFVDIKGFPDGSFIPCGRNAGRIEQVHGGVARNIAEDIANIAGNSTFLSLMDNSGIASDVLGRLKEVGVNTEYIRATENGMGTWLAVFNESGDVVASISKRPDLIPLGELINDVGDEAFPDADSVIFELDMEPEAVEPALYFARKYGIPTYAVVSNMTIALERKQYLPMIDCLICNRQEAGIFFGEDLGSQTPVELADRISKLLLTSDFDKMVVTLGGEGSIYADKRGEHGVCPAEDVAVVDTTGAGDAFAAGFVVGMTRGDDMSDSCRLGAHIAASVISRGAGMRGRGDAEDAEDACYFLERK